MAYETGYQHAITLAAERVDELDAIWRTVPRPTYEQNVAERVALFEHHAVTDWPGLDNGGVLPSADWA
jgi:hypothetical protein